MGKNVGWDADTILDAIFYIAGKDRIERLLMRRSVFLLLRPFKDAFGIFMCERNPPALFSIPVEYDESVPAYSIKLVCEHADADLS